MTGTAIDDPRWFAQLTPVFRPIAFALLIDASASSISGRGSFLRKGVAQANALTAALSAEGHCVAAFSFCSRSHERVEVRLLKEFSEPYVPFGHSIKPAGYTRLGAAIRHVGQRLSLAPAEARILLTLGEGVPSDEGYDGRYGQMDVAKAIEEQRQAGVLVRHLLPEARSDTHSNDTLDAVFGPFGWMSVESLAELHQVMTTLAYEVRG
jgi:nitric oxide reductase activation protein